MKIKSVFINRERIPSKYTCDGKNVSPEIEIFDIPESSKTLALIVDDPDSPSKTWTHWILWNIPADTKKIEENSVPSEALQGINDFEKTNYGGPCPRKGMHRYQFKLYALDVKLNLPPDCTKNELESAMEGHILDRALLIGLYSKILDN